jgi:hypothetical protein
VISNVSVRPLSAGHWLLPAVAGWVPLAVAQMVLALIVYSVVQQDIRQSANEPQIELAESAASRLSSDEPVQTVLPARSVDLSGSLAPFVIVYDGAGTVLASSASLQGQTPRLPSGTLGSVTRGLESGSRAPGVVRTIFSIRALSSVVHGEKPRLPSGAFGSMVRDGGERFTWAPEPGVRIATVLVRYEGASSGFVLAGRSLREVERLEDHLLSLVALGLLLGLTATLGAAIGVAALTCAVRAQQPASGVGDLKV